MAARRISLKRIYDPAATGDGQRVLVDRVWPRGIRKADAHIDRWLRELAPSTELRKWFHHDPERWEQFRQRYRAELIENTPPAFHELVAMCREHNVTLLFAARDREHNQAVVLRELLDEALAASPNANTPASPVCYAEFQDHDDDPR